MLSTDGDARPLLILLPGLDGTGKRFADFIDVLKPGIDTRIVSYPTDLPLGYEELERRVRDGLPGDRAFVLLGESFSGPIAIRIAARPPPGLKGVILCATFARNPFPWLRWARPLVQFVPIKSLPRWLRAPLLWGTPQRARTPANSERAIAAVADSVVRRRVAELLACNVSTEVRSIALPMLVLHGRADRVVSLSAARRIHASARAAELIDIDGPHLLLQARAAECAGPVREFVRRCMIA
jgi:pimeloyl-ACP methyl ester carboxylesterase